MATNTVLARLAIMISANSAQLGKTLNSASSQLKSFQNTIRGIGNAIGVSLGAAALYQGVKQVVSIMSDFEHTMQTLKAISGATGAEFRSLERDAERLGASTKFTASQVGELQIAYSRLGFNTKEIRDATEATLDLAAATGEDLAKSADVAGSTVRGFGLRAKETHRVVDVMAASFNRTALSLENFTESMKYVAPIAAAANVTVEETTALLGVLADSGIRGSQAGTALRKIFADLSKDGRPFAERLDELAKKGITLSDSFDEVGRYAQTALLVLTKNKDKADELTKSFGDVSGEAARMARIMQDDLTGDVTKLTSAFEGLIIQITNSDGFRNITQQLTDLVNVASGAGQNLDRTFKEIAYTLTQSGDLNLFSDRDIDANISRFVERLKEIRREQGKPFDLRIVDELAEKYNLTSRGVGAFRRALEQANGSLSFQEQTIKNFKNSKIAETYGETKDAIDKYIESLNKVILAETNRQQGLKQFDLTEGTNVFGKDIANAQTQIDSALRQIEILKSFAEDLEGANKKVVGTQEVVTLSLKHYKDALKAVNDEFDTTDKNDLTKLRNLAAQATGYELIIKRLEKLKSLGDLEFQIKVPDTSDILNPADFTLPNINLDSLLSDDMVKRFVKRLQETQRAFKEFKGDIQTEFEGLNLSGLVAGALDGIGEALGNAIAGTQSLGKSLLAVFGGVLSQFGKMLIAAGVGLIGIKKAFQSLNGYVAIAAGVALVALGAAVSGSIKGLGSSQGTSGGGGAASSSNFNSERKMTDAQDVRLSATTVLRGQDLYIMFSNYQSNNKYTKAGG